MNIPGLAILPENILVMMINIYKDFKKFPGLFWNAP
jgi:hypothetical protein